MSQACFPDPAHSRALLIGASHFTTAGPELPDIPAVQANLTALRQTLTNSHTGVLRPESCRVLTNPAAVDEVGTALSELAATATDLLLVYYAGHGLVDDRGRLHLALANTHPHRARWTAFPLELLREEIANSAAVTRVLILDCCFSGRAIEAMSDDRGVISGQLEVAGTYTLTSTTANAPSHAPIGDRFTAFTGALLRALNDIDPLTLDQIFIAVDRDLVAQNLPRPQRRAINTAGNLTLSHGPTTHSPTEPPNSDTVRFTPACHPPTGDVLSVFGAIFHVLLSLSLLLSAFLAFLVFLFIASTSLSLIGALILVLTALAPLIPIAVNITRPGTSRLGRAVYVLKNSASGVKDIHVRELVVDHSGLTIRKPFVEIHLSWQNIAQIGVLQPERRALNHRLPADQYAQTDLLVVRLRPEFPAPMILSVLSDEHRQLGYLGLCTVEELGSSHQEMTSALERFAGGKLVHSSRQFLDRDSRLRPEMV
ncbi:MAG: caspase family protein [Pseudonocardiaceae bacterium]